MDVRNCRGCGKLFNYLSGPNLCQECKDAIEHKYENVKEYVQDNPSCTIQEICDANDVTSQQIHQWIREERLQFADDSPIGIACEICGGNIKTGRFCEACRNKMAAGFAQQYEQKDAVETTFQPVKDNKMRFF